MCTTREQLMSRRCMRRSCCYGPKCRSSASATRDVAKHSIRITRSKLGSVVNLSTPADAITAPQPKGLGRRFSKSLPQPYPLGLARSLVPKHSVEVSDRHLYPPPPLPHVLPPSPLASSRACLHGLACGTATCRRARPEPIRHYPPKCQPSSSGPARPERLLSGSRRLAR